MRKRFFRALWFLQGALRKLFSITQSCSCLICSEKAGLIPVCSACRKKYFVVNDGKSFFCAVCGKRLVSESGLCLECRKEKLLKSTDGVFPIFSYRLWNTTLLCRWKLEDERTLSGFFASLLKEKLERLKEEKGSFVLVPVPPRKNKIKEKGWDQVEELVSILELLYDFPVLRLLERVSVIQQKKLDRIERLETVGKSYVLKKQDGPLPEKVCLIDDVITTGATIESCAEQLKSGGIKTVFAVSLFTVDS